MHCWGCCCRALYVGALLGLLLPCVVRRCIVGAVAAVSCRCIVAIAFVMTFIALPKRRGHLNMKACCKKGWCLKSACTRKEHLVHLLCVLNKKGHLVCGHLFTPVSKLPQCSKLSPVFQVNKYTDA